MTDPAAAPPLMDRKVLGFRVLFLFGAFVGALFSLAVMIWTGVARDVIDPCSAGPEPRPVYARSMPSGALSAVALGLQDEPEPLGLGREGEHERPVHVAERGAGPDLADPLGDVVPVDVGAVGPGHLGGHPPERFGIVPPSARPPHGAGEPPAPPRPTSGGSGNGGAGGRRS